MNRFAQFLQDVKPQNILDVATGSGSFIGLIRQLYGDYRSIVGIDALSIAVRTATKNHQDDSRIRFERMDAEQMRFRRNSFDLVCLSNSLHHLADTDKVLREMHRVKKPDGYVLISEMVSDQLTKAQLSHLKIHHFAAAVDRHLGEIHGDTLSRADLLARLETTSDMTIVDHWVLDYHRAGESSDSEIQWLNDTIDKLVDRVTDPDAKAQFRQTGNEIKQYIKVHGFESATTYMVVLQ